MKTLRCCVIDDEPLAARLIASYIEKTPTLTLAGTFSSPEEAVKTVMSGEADLLFLDIMMPGLNGMEFARLVPKGCRIIFTTAYDKFAIEGYKVNAVDYLLKPVSYKEFLDAVGRVSAITPATDGPQIREKDFIVVKSGFKLIRIKTDDIEFVEGMKDYALIHVAGERHAVTALIQLKNLEQTLPSPRFMRVHRSFIVNTDRIRVVERNQIIFGDRSIPVGENYKAAFAEFLSRGMQTHGE